MLKGGSAILLLGAQKDHDKQTDHQTGGESNSKASSEWKGQNERGDAAVRGRPRWRRSLDCVGRVLTNGEERSSSGSSSSSGGGGRREGEGRGRRKAGCGQTETGQAGGARDWLGVGPRSPGSTRAPAARAIQYDNGVQPTGARQRARDTGRAGSAGSRPRNTADTARAILRCWVSERARQQTADSRQTATGVESERASQRVLGGTEMT